jgi:Carboxypeptidase regulatory-like domain
MSTRSRVVIAIVLVALACACKSTGDTPGRVVDAGATATGSVSGVLRRANGEAVSGATINAESTDLPRKPVPEVKVITDDAGHFVWPLNPGRYRLTVTIEGFGTAAAQVLVGKVTPDVELVLP